LLVPYGIQVIVAVNGEDAFKTLRSSNVTVANNHLHDIGHLGIAYVAVHTLERPPSMRWAGVIAGAVCLFGVAVVKMTKPIEFVWFFTPEFVYFSTPEQGGVSKTSAGHQTSRSSLQKKQSCFWRSEPALVFNTPPCSGVYFFLSWYRCSPGQVRRSSSVVVVVVVIFGFCFWPKTKTKNLCILK